MCDHEKADAKIAVHVLHAVNKGHNQVLMRTVDTDIVVIMIGLDLQLIVIFTSLFQCLHKFGYGKALPAYKCRCHLFIS